MFKKYNAKGITLAKLKKETKCDEVYAVTKTKPEDFTKRAFGKFVTRCGFPFLVPVSSIDFDKYTSVYVNIIDDNEVLNGDIYVYYNSKYLVLDVEGNTENIYIDSKRRSLVTYILDLYKESNDYLNMLSPTQFKKIHLFDSLFVGDKPLSYNIIDLNIENYMLKLNIELHIKGEKNE